MSAPPRVVLDADFNNAHALGIVALLKPPTQILLTSYVAKFELTPLQDELRELERFGTLKTNSVTLNNSNETGRRYRTLMKEARQRKSFRVDKGECEIVAWSLGEKKDERPIFISCDDQARRFAESKGLEAGGLLLLVCLLVECGAISFEGASECLRAWDDDKHSGRCRPKDYAGLRSALIVRGVATG